MKNKIVPPRRHAFHALAAVSALIFATAAPAQTLFVSVRGDNSITRITPNGTSGTKSTFAMLDYPYGVAFDTSGNLYAANYNYGTISKVTPGGVVSGFATGVTNGIGLAFDSNGNLYAANHSLAGTMWKITPAAVVSTFASSGMSYPYGVAIDSSNNVYAANWADTPHANTTVSKITPGGAVSDYLTGLTAPEGLAFDGSNNLYVSNYYAGTISKRTPQGVVSEFASGLSGPLGLAFDPVTGSLFVANTDGGTISAITTLGVVSQFASGLDRPLFIAVGTSAIPEPSTSALLVGLGALGFAAGAAGIARSVPIFVPAPAPAAK